MLIPRWHLAVELTAVSVFLLAVVVSPDRPVLDLALLLALLAILLALTVVDLRHLLLPDPLVAALAVVGVARSLVLGDPGVPGSLLGGAVGLMSLGVLAFIPWRRGEGVSMERASSAMGLGDVKLAGAMGLALGFPGLFTALFGAFIAGGVVGALLIVAGRAKLKSHIPFGPFLCGVTAALLLFPELSATFFRLLGFV